MKMNLKLIFLLSALAAISIDLHAEQLSISLMPVDGVQRGVYTKAINQFREKYPRIDVKVRVDEHEYYKQHIDQFLIETPNKADVYFWFGGQKLKNLAAKGAVFPLTQAWNRNNWNRNFSDSTRAAITFNNQMYGLPLYYYQWGFYYSKSLFQKLNLEIPVSWEDFIDTCNKLSKSGITPIALASNDLWPNASWFDYFNLRINGLEFHNQLMAGTISYESQEVTTVFNYWKQLLDAQAFTANHEELEWHLTLPRIFHKKEGMILMGNFLLALASDTVRNDLGFFPFPILDKTVPRFEEAPLDILIVSQNSTNKKEALLFLEFMATPVIQSQIASELYMTPANVKAKRSRDEFIDAGYKLIESAEGTSQFFDRDSIPEFSEAAMSSLVSFLTHRDIRRVQTELEQLRLKFY